MCVLQTMNVILLQRLFEVGRFIFGTICKYRLYYFKKSLFRIGNIGKKLYDKNKMMT